jgi:N-acetylmuramoyl-L-alanine amidase
MHTIVWKGSPHFTPDIRRVSHAPHHEPPLIVLHTMDGSLEGTLAHFQHPATKVSSHYGVGREGQIHQYVHETDAAWTNGWIRQPTSSAILQRGGNPNHYTITIEFEGRQKGGTLTEPQYQAGLWLIQQIASRWHLPLTREFIIGHCEIDSLGKPHCPGPFFPWTRLMGDLTHSKKLIPICRNGIPIAMGYLDSAVTYAPIRQVAERLGYTVRWDDLEYVVDITGDPKTPS